MRQSTKPTEHAWLARCRYGNCQEEKVRCPVCKKPGHVTAHIQNTKDNHFVNIAIQHSHFVENVDAGRNMFCETEYNEGVASGELRAAWRLTPFTRKMLIEHYARKLSK